MDETEDVAVQTARVNVRQAIVVATITGVVTILTTLLATGNLLPRNSKDGTSARGGETAASSAVMDAPDLSFAAKPIGLSLADCMAKAQRALGRMELTGVESGRYWSWGYRNETVGLIWCNTDEELAIFVGAAPRDAETEDRIVTELQKSF